MAGTETVSQYTKISLHYHLGIQMK